MTISPISFPEPDLAALSEFVAQALSKVLPMLHKGVVPIRMPIRLPERAKLSEHLLSHRGQWIGGIANVAVVCWHRLSRDRGQPLLR